MHRVLCTKQDDHKDLFTLDGCITICKKIFKYLCFSFLGPKGESGLHFVMTEWVSRQQMFYGSYENKVQLFLSNFFVQLVLCLAIY